MSLLDAEKVKKAVKALVHHINSAGKKNAASDSAADEAQPLFEEDPAVWLIVSVKKIPEKTKNAPHLIPLKHSLLKEDSEICLFTKDPQADYKKIIKDNEISQVSKVIGITKLRQKYKPFEAKRLLCSSYDVFMADDRVLPLLPKLLGKTFFMKKKLPMPVNLKKSDVKKEIEKAMSSTVFYLSPGASSSIRIGKIGMGVEKLHENIMFSTDKIMDKIPKKWDNIQSIYIKTSDSVALPIYVSLPDGPKQQSKSKLSEEEIDRLKEKKKQYKLAQKEEQKRMREEQFDIDNEEDSLFMKKLMKKIKLEI